MKRKWLLLILTSMTLSSVPVISEAVQVDKWEYTKADKLSNVIKPGKYKIGDKVPAGEYKIFAKSENAYVAILNDSNGTDIASNELFETQTYISVEDGQFLELKNCYAVKFDEKNDMLKSDKFADGYFEGTFKVGYDIPAGEYSVEMLPNIMKQGYWAIHTDVSSNNNILANELFENSTFLTVEDGQYLNLRGAIIKK